MEGALSHTKEENKASEKQTNHPAAAEQGTGVGVGQEASLLGSTRRDRAALPHSALLSTVNSGRKDLDAALQSPSSMLSPLILLTQGKAMGRGQQL